RRGRDHSGGPSRLRAPDRPRRTPPEAEPRCNMRTTAIAHTWRTSLAWSAVFRAARLSIFGFIAWLWFFAAADSASRTVSLVAVLALATVVGITWYASRARADRRWRAALDRYAQQEQAKRTHPRSGIDVEGDGYERHS